MNEQKIYRTLVLGEGGAILSVLESDRPLAADALDGTAYAGKEVRAVDGGAYAAGHKLAEYTVDGKLRPLIDRVKEGLTPIPEGYELVDGEIVPRNPTVKETPKYLQETIDKLRAQVAALQKELIGL